MENPFKQVYSQNESTILKVTMRDQESSRESSEEIEAAQKFIVRHQELFYSIVRDRSLSFRVGDGFYIDLENGMISLNIDDFKGLKEKKVSETQILWSVCHELAHFMDMREDANGLLENFAYCKRRAKELAPKVIEIWQRKNGQELPEYMTRQVPLGKDNAQTISFVEKFVYDCLARFYNVLDDIYVNRMVSNRVGAFSSDGSRSAETVRFYRDYLFPTDPEKRGQPPKDRFEAADFSEYPKSQQLVESILREYMVPDQAVLVSPEVSAAHRSFTDANARSVGIDLKNEVIKVLTNPASKLACKAKTRYSAIKRNIEPRFLELLFQDLEEQPLPKENKPTEKNTKSKDDEGRRQQGQSDPWSNLNQPSPSIDENQVKKYIKDKNKKDKKDAEKIAKDQRTPAQKLKDAEAAKNDNLIDKSIVDAEEKKEVKDAIRRYQEIKEEVSGLRRELAQVFEQVMRTIEERIGLVWMEGFKSGKLNVKRFIQKYSPELSVERLDLLPWNALDVYDQKDFISQLSLVPNRIRVRLVLDGSGSMNPERIHALQQLTVLLMEGLTAFEETVNLRYRLKRPFKVDTEIRMFGTDSRVVKSFAEQKTFDDEKVERFKAFAKIHNGWGGTDDAIPLAAINQTIDPDSEKDLKTGKCMEFVFEITDGGSQNAHQSAILVDTLINKKVIAKAFQIGEPSEEEKEIFQQIWKKHGSEIPDPASLASELAKMLAHEISDVRFSVQDEAGLESDDSF